MRVGILAVVGTVALCSLTPPALGTEQARFEVAQPLPSGRSQDCLEVGRVSYLINVGSARAGQLVALTCAYGPVGVFRGWPGGTNPPELAENPNAASHAGLAIKVRDIPFEDQKVIPATLLKSGAPWIRPASNATRYVDTLEVELDATTYASSVSRADSTMARYGFRRSRPDPLIACTVDCILDNAARETFPVRFVRLTIIGAPSLRTFSRTYPVAAPRYREYCEYAPVSPGSAR